MPLGALPAGAYRKYLLGVLFVILAFNFVDRAALGLMLQDIKQDLGLSDTQLGLLSGIAFALFYSVMGIPIARWADRGNRVLIITLTTALWSTMVGLCGLATSYAQLILIRIGIAVGEAGCIPPAHSLIADYFNRAERPRAVAIYMLGAPASVLVGFFVAGWLNQLYGWRTTFILLGIPGAILALIAGLTLKEPRNEVGTQGAAAAQAPAMGEVLATLWRNRTFRHLLIGFSVMLFFGYGTLQWQPAFFIRSHGMKTGELGTWFAFIYGVAGLAGTYLGGELASRYAANREALQLRLLAAVIAICAFFKAMIFLAVDMYTAFAMLGIASLVVNAASGPLFATIQTLVPGRMRAMSIALIYLFGNLIGMGLGPLMAGTLSDLFRPRVGEESLRYALLILCPGYFWAGWHLWRGSRTVEGDLEPDRISLGPALSSRGLGRRGRKILR